MVAKKRKARKRKTAKRNRTKSLFDYMDLKPKTKRRIKKISLTSQIIAVVLLVLLLYPVLRGKESSKIQTQPATAATQPQTPLTRANKNTVPAPRTSPPLVTSFPKELTTTKVVREWSSNPKLTFVIDDIGHNLNNELELIALGGEVTYAILPFLKFSSHFGHLSRRTGAEVILHLPLEALDGTIPGPGLITNRMPKDYVKEQLNRDLSTVPFHVGVNNHMGSAGTADYALMTTILQELKTKGLFFLDSQTNLQSIGWRVGKQIGVPALRRDVFLDNVDEKEAIRKQVQTLAKVALRRGYAIGIGHDRHNTLTVLSEEIPRLRTQGFEMISLADLIDFQNSRSH